MESGWGGALGVLGGQGGFSLKAPAYRKSWEKAEKGGKADFKDGDVVGSQGLSKETEEDWKMV